MKTEEGLTQDKIIERLREEGFLVMRINSGRRGKIAFNRWYMPIPDDMSVIDQEYYEMLCKKSHTGGVSDLIALREGIPPLFIETKSKKGKPSKNQKMFLLAVELCGGIRVVPHSIEEFEMELNKIILRRFEEWE
jgi:Holliday junction resolvase